MNYTHLIISRVNVRWTSHSKDEKWLKDRIEIINKTLRPSIEAQKNKNFKFITLWGYEPEGGIDGEIQIKIDSKGTKNIYDELLKKIKEHIDSENVLVTRVDSDNCLGEDFVDNLQKRITDKVPYYYDTKYIEIYYMDNGNKNREKYNSTSGFISVMEKTDEFECIPYKHPHDNIKNIIKGISIDELDVLLNIHENNIAPKRNDRGKPYDFNLKKYNMKL